MLEPDNTAKCSGEQRHLKPCYRGVKEGILLYFSLLFFQTFIFGPMWHLIDNPPVKTGLYIVAEFVDNKLMAYCDWALVNEPGEPYYWGPNNTRSFDVEHYTHWMSKEEYRKLLESLPRE